MKWIYVVGFVIMYVGAFSKRISWELATGSMLFLFSIIYLSKMK